ncbi:ABC transporter substrate-binding protein [Cellulosimicrobium protaetiae]|uniref:ABC transporter substrate-binding protein n=1 Tax=Cellulosimicrobium protaetiae TaxID=2587808 RepID=A0A6M5UDT9_9MICO|nr:ABC transporter substrate-binding protein [Cellulosimicrobium protaetiae]QJW35405.1 ABC transporter substrate-binding protein [Cellulosimicrobium protaetiae]
MRTSRKLPLTGLVALAATSALLLTACTDASQTGTDGSTAGSDGETSAAPSFDPSTIEVDEAAAALLPEDIASAGTLTVGSNLEYAPAEFVDTDGQTPIGFDIDVIKAVGATLGLEVDVQSADFPAIIPALGTKFDAGISSFTITEERMQESNMISFLSAGSAYAVASGNPDDIDPSSLCGLTVAVQTGTIQDEDIAVQSQACTDAGEEEIDILQYDSQADATTNLVGGKAQVMYADSPVVGYAIEQTGDQIEQLGDVFDSAPQGIVVAKDATDLAAAIQAALQSLMDSGQLVEVLDGWGSGDAALDTAEINPSVG